MDKTLRLWDIIEGKLLFIKDLQPFGKLWGFVKFADDGKIIVVRCQEKVVGISINGDLMYTISVTNDKLIEIGGKDRNTIYIFNKGEIIVTEAKTGRTIDLVPIPDYIAITRKNYLSYGKWRVNGQNQCQ